MTYTSKKERGTSARSSLLTLIVVMLVGLFTVGCGDSGEDFVVTGNNGNAVPTGNVTFQFAKAQNIATVPAATTRLIFEFLDASGARTGNAADVAFANSVTLAVPTVATRAVVRAVDATGATLQTVTFTFTVLQNQTVIATVSGGGTTGTTTGNTTGTTTGNTTGSTTGNTTGSTTGNTTGSTTGNTTGSTTGNTTGGTPASISVSPSAVTVAPGGTSGVFTVRFTPANSTASTEVTNVQAQVINVNPAQFDPSVTPADPTDTLTYFAATRQVVVGTAVLPGTTATLRFTFIPPTGGAVTRDVAVTVGTAAQAQAVTGVEIVSIVAPKTLNLVQLSQYPITIAERRADGTLTALDWSNAGVQARFDLVPTSGPAIATFTEASGQLAVAAAGTGQVFTLRENPTPGGVTAPTNRDSFTVNGETFNAVQFSSVTFNQANYNLRAGASINYTVTLTTPTGRTTDLTAVWQVMPANMAVATAGLLVVDPTPNAYQLFTGVFTAPPTAVTTSNTVVNNANPADLALVNLAPAAAPTITIVP